MGSEKCRLRQPQSFIKALMPGYHQKLHIPPVFAMSVSEEQLNRGLAWIRSGVGRTWEVLLQRDPSDDGLCFVGYWWRDFVQMHGLQVGYFLCFRHEGDMRFSVLVFDYSTCNKTYVPFAYRLDNEDETTGRRAEHGLEEKEQDPEEDPIKSRHFEATIRYSSVHKHYLYIPTEFTKQHNLRSVPQAQLTSSRGKWPVRLQHCLAERYKGTKFSTGWKEFRIKNQLMVGDKCVFELIHTENGVAVFRMTRKRKRDSFSESEKIAATSKNNTLVFDAEDDSPLARRLKGETDKPVSTDKLLENGTSDDEDDHCNIRSDNEKDTTSDEVAAHDYSEKRQRLEKATVWNQCFQVTIQKSNVYENSYMSIPKAFLEQHNLWGIMEARLTSSRGQWHVHIRYLEGQNFARIDRGWKDFQIKNDLRIGDNCTFILIHSNENMAAFHVTKKSKIDSDCEDIATTRIKNIVVIDVEDDSPSLCELDRGTHKLVSKDMLIENGASGDEDEYCNSMSGNEDKTSNEVFTHTYTEMKQSLDKATVWIRFFEVSIKKSNVNENSYMNFPNAFLNQHNLWGIMQAQLTSSRGQWHVHIHHVKGKNCARIIRGWKDFQIKNDLRIGDVCTFMLIHIKKKMAVFHVTKKSKQDSSFNKSTITSRKSNMVVDVDHNSPALCDFSSQILEHTTERTAVDTILGLADVEMIKVEHAESKHQKEKTLVRTKQFRVTMRLSKVSRRIHMQHIPAWFVRMHNLWGIRQAQVISSRGQWFIDIYQYLRRGKTRARFSRGWGVFQIENELRIGDTCIFLLMHTKKEIVVFHVIKRAKRNLRDFTLTEKSNTLVAVSEDNTPSLCDDQTTKKLPELNHAKNKNDSNEIDAISRRNDVMVIDDHDDNLLVSSDSAVGPIIKASAEKIPGDSDRDLLRICHPEGSM